MGIAEEIEQWLQGQENQYPNPNYDIVRDPETDQRFAVPRPIKFYELIEELTESPKVRYKPDVGWYRKCHRCHCAQRPEDRHKAEFKQLVHMCVRDGFVKSVMWQEKK